MSKGWGRGSTRASRRIRELVLIRDHGMCQIREPGTWVTGKSEIRQCLEVADCVHHTVGRAITHDDPRYMVAACTPCNLKVGDPSVDPPIGRALTRW